MCIRDRDQPINMSYWHLKPPKPGEEHGSRMRDDVPDHAVSYTHLLLLKKENQQMDMIEYLLSKEKVTDEEALDMARRLAAK